MVGSRHPNGQKPRAEWVKSEDKGGATGCAALLGIVISEYCALSRDAVDVGRAATHHSTVVGADVPHSNVVAEYHEDVGFICGISCAVINATTNGNNCKHYD